MTKKEIRQKYCDKRNYTSWNKYNITEYSKWLENELIKAQKKVKNLTIPVVVKQSEQFNCFEMHAYSRFAGCGEQCKECAENEKSKAI